MKKISNTFVILFTLSILFSLYFVQRTLPQMRGNIQISGLSDSTFLYSDKYGIPHIRSKNDRDAFKVLGYKTASERLFQMDLLRRLVSGRLSEIFGDKTVEADKMLRTLGFKRLSQKMISDKTIEMDSKLIDLATAYLEGVHEFIDHGALPLEFTLLNYTPERFDLADILAVSGYMSLTFAEGIIGDVLFSDLIDKLPEEKIALLRIGADSDKQYFKESIDRPESSPENKEEIQIDNVKPEKTVKVLRNEFYRNFSQSLDQINDIYPLFHGSNSWVLSGARTQSGSPVLANDPHIAIGNPHIFFEAHLQSPNYELYGHYIPLVPFAIMGHTLKSAWGMTMSELDDLNIYEEKVNPKNPNQVQYMGEWEDLIIHSETIKVKDSKDQIVTIKSSRHGPIIDNTKYGLMGKTLSLAWSALSEQNNVMMTFFKLPHVETIDDLKGALDFATAPGLNITWANKAGDIAWWVMGKTPKLPTGVQTDIALKGWDGSAEADGYYTIEENPHSINPESGVIVSANYKPMLGEFEHFDGYWQPGGRFFRLEDLLSKQETWGIKDLKKIQTDLILPAYKEIKKELIQSLDQKVLNSIENQAYQIFKDWNGSTDAKNVGSTIFHMWSYHLYRSIYLDELGEEGFKAFGKTADFWHSFKALLKNKQHSFWDNILTNRVERGDEIILLAFRKAMDELQTKLGVSAQKWEWGRIHKIEFKHALGKVDVLKPIFNIGPYSASGGRYIINNLGHRKSTNNFSVVHGPATRRIIDMANPQKSLGIIPTGNSGNPFSPHYDDQTSLYLKGKYRLQNMDWNELKKLPYVEFSN